MTPFRVNKSDWAPSCSLETARYRRDLTDRVRSFFRQRNALEVQTPVLAEASGSDPHLDWFQTESFVDGAGEAKRQPKFLMTSPEFHMKRLLAAGWGDIWQLTRAFRNSDRGERHLEEFSVLEWYRVGWSIEELMQEVWEIASLALELKPWKTISYREAFKQFCAVDPFDPDGIAGDGQSSQQLFQECCRRSGVAAPELKGEERLFWLHGAVVAPQLGWEAPQFLVDWPPSQAALAQIEIDRAGNRVGRRFELYVKGMELCNGYQELTDDEEQRNRFESDQKERELLGKRPAHLDEKFLAALKSGLPRSSGVALGFDRLVMLALGREVIDEVVTFKE